MSRIGIVALGSTISTGGGVDIYTQRLVSALADFDAQNSYIVIVNEIGASNWSHRDWPTNVQFAVIHSAEPPLSNLNLIRYGLRHLLGSPLPKRHGEAYIARQIEELQVDLLHYPSTVIYPLEVDTACILTFFDLQHEYYPQFFSQAELEWRRRNYQASVDKAAHVVVPSRYTQNTLAETYDTPASKMTLIPPGLSNGFHRTDIKDVHRIRAKYGLPDTFIIYPANPWPHKNHARLMAALRIYRLQFGEPPPLALTGRLRDEPRDALSLAIAAGVEDRVVDLGFVPTEDFPALYSAATLLVFPSLFEGFGLPLVEAMACGCPIAAANSTAIPECVNGAAVLFDPLNPEEICRAIRLLMTNHDLRVDLVQRGYQQMGRFGWAESVSRLADIYEQVASR